MGGGRATTVRRKMFRGEIDGVPDGPKNQELAAKHDVARAPPPLRQGRDGLATSGNQPGTVPGIPCVCLNPVNPVNPV